MLQEVLDRVQTSDYDFRATAYPHDPYRHLFDEWVPYYRTKWAIADLLQPTRILEIGVRYGYSALAFLTACPHASYLGIDLDSDSYGGVQGAIQWAREKAKNYRADFMIADTQNMTSLPGGCYDLVHIDGQQNQSGIIHDLELAVNQARFILVDGYFWTRDNFLAASEFLYQNRDLVEFYGVFPSYAGELLIKVRDTTTLPTGMPRSSGDLRETYTEDYYLLNCGGFESFNRSGGELEDSRLRAVVDIALASHPGRALDLGCGRGEVCLNLARHGFEVTGIDYSRAAITLAQSLLAHAPALEVTFQCSDLNDAALAGLYDVIICSDVVEHLTPLELDRTYARLARYLAPEGLLIVHTFPNAWFYRYEYPKRRRLAQALGAYLPVDPRSRHEKLMHINEQSPRVLRRQISRYFPHVVLWFAEHDLRNPAEYLGRRLPISTLRSAGDLFALASHAPIDLARVAGALKMDPISGSLEQLSISILRTPVAVAAGSRFSFEVEVSNQSFKDLKSYPPYPVHLSYHWFDAGTGKCVVFDGERTPLYSASRSGSKGEYRLSANAPDTCGMFRLRATLVQEAVAWLDTEPWRVFSDALVKIDPPGPEN